MKETKEVRSQRTYKDTVFRMLFREKENLLSLYNAVNGTVYTNVEELEITTLENAERMPFAEAVETAVDDCIKNGILSDFLSKNRAEAIEMSIFEYDKEKHLKNEREYAYREGRADGIKIITFILKCSNQGDSKEMVLQKLQKSYSLSQEEAEMYYMEIEDNIIRS